MIYRWCDMIYLLRKHDIISVPSYAEGIYHPFPRGTDITEKSHLCQWTKVTFFVVRATGLDLHFLSPQWGKKIDVATSFWTGSSKCPPDTCIEMGSSPVFHTNKKSTPKGCFSYWCGQQDSTLHALAVEPKGNVTLVMVLMYGCLLTFPHYLF